MNSSELAKLIVAEIYSSGSTYLIICLIMIISGATAYLTRYLERKAENYVTREDFQSLQAQLEKSTRLVEGIKAEVLHADWARREWFAIRSKKLEELTEALNALMVQVNDAPTRVVTQDIESSGKQLDTVNTLATLYFPELWPRIAYFLDEVVKFYVFLQETRVAQQEGKHVDVANLVQTSTHKKLVDEHRKIQLDTAQLLRESAIEAGLLKKNE